MTQAWRSEGPVLDFLRRLWALDHALHKASKRMERTLGLTGPQRLVLRVVAQMPGASAGELAAVLHVHKSTLTGIVQRLERRRSLRRLADARDARRARFRVTVAGRGLARPRAGTIEATISRLLAQTSRAQIDACAGVLGAAAAALDRDAGVVQPGSHRVERPGKTRGPQDTPARRRARRTAQA